MNLIPANWSSPEPPPLFKMPIKSLNLTGSAHRSRSVDNDSDTAWCPLWAAFGISPRVFSSQAMVSNWSARILARMPVPVEEHAKGNNPTGVVPKRDAASLDREQQMLKHCLVEDKEGEMKIYFIPIKDKKLNSQASQFIELCSTLIWLIVAHLGVLRVQRAASCDCVLRKLNCSQHFQQQTHAVHWTLNKFLNEAEEKKRKSRGIMKLQIGRISITEEANHFVIKNLLALWDFFSLWSLASHSTEERKQKQLFIERYTFHLITSAFHYEFFPLVFRQDSWTLKPCDLFSSSLVSS